MQNEKRINYIVGDVHGEYNLVKKIVDKISEPITWLGDYFDSFHATVETQIKTFELIASRPDDTMLLGNHDLHYVYPESRRVRGSGYRKESAYVIHDVIMEYFDRMAYCKEIDGYYLTHAGIHPRLYDNFKKDATLRYEFDEDGGIESWLNCQKKQFREEDKVYHCSSSRGGTDKYPGIFWMDFSDHVKMALEMHPVFKQIFGHSSRPCMNNGYSRVIWGNTDLICIDSLQSTVPSIIKMEDGQPFVIPISQV